MTLTLEITPKIGCPMACSFCPQSNLLAAYTDKKRELTLDDFRHVLSKLPKDCQIHFSGYVEPFTSHLAGEMINLAKQDGREVHLYTTCMGISKTPYNSVWLRAIPPDFIRIHVPDVVSMVIPDQKWIAEHEFFHDLHLPATYMTMGYMTPRVEQYMNYLGIHVEAPEMLSRGGNLWKGNRKEGKIICAMDRWSQNVLLPNGAVYLCCCDYSLSTQLGNLFTEDYSVIHNRAMVLREAERKPEMCYFCEWSRPA